MTTETPPDTGPSNAGPDDTSNTPPVAETPATPESASPTIPDVPALEKPAVPEVPPIEKPAAPAPPEPAPPAPVTPPLSATPPAPVTPPAPPAAPKSVAAPASPAIESPVTGSEQSDAPADTSADTATLSTPRKLRLNPTMNPAALKSIPSLRSASQPPTVTPPAATPPSSPGSSSATTGDATSPSPTEGTESTSATPAEKPSATEEPVQQYAVRPPPPADPVALPSKDESLDADLEAELEAAMTGEQQQAEAEAAAIEEAAAIATSDDEEKSPTPAGKLPVDAELKSGMRLKGTVQSIHGDDMFIELGLRMAGVLSRRQFGLRKQPMQGEPIDIVVGRVDEKESLIHVNLPTGVSRIRGDWDALSVDQHVECLVSGTNKGGLEVTVGSLRGFIPASQVELGYVPDLGVYVGQKLKARVAEVNPKRRKLVLSRRSLLEAEREVTQKELFEKINPGQQFTGRVRTIKDYGAFVDIGGADGLLHVAQMSWSRINHPSEILSEGEEINVQVLSVDKEQKKISLGMRQLTENPWKSVESKYAQGAVIKGKVTRIETFGAFVALEDGVEGLVHISELDHKRINKVSEVLRVGQEVDVQVLEVDPKKKRVSLSVKALKEKPEDPADKAASVPIKRKRSAESLVGGIGAATGGQLFGDPNKFEK